MGFRAFGSASAEVVKEGHHLVVLFYLIVFVHVLKVPKTGCSVLVHSATFLRPVIAVFMSKAKPSLLKQAAVSSKLTFTSSF